MDGSPNVSSLRVTREILGLIAEIDEFKGAWLAIGRLAPERLSRLRHVATIESVGSSTRIEGARLSDPEVEQLLSAIEVGSFATRDEQEVAGYADTMNTVFTAWEVIDLTENHARQLHRDLLQYSEKDERNRGAATAETASAGHRTPPPGLDSTRRMAANPILSAHRRRSGNRCSIADTDGFSTPRACEPGSGTPTEVTSCASRSRSP